MKLLKIIAVLMSLFSLSCMTSTKALPPINIPNVPNPSTHEDKEKTVNKIPTDVELIMKDFVLPAEVNAEEKVGDPLTLVMNNNVKFSVTPKRENYKSGAAVYYPFVPNYLYKIYTSPFNVTVIQLEPGERIISQPVSGDVHSFVLGTQYAYVDTVKTTQIHLQPTVTGKQTTLIINTDKRTYYFLLYSYKETFMPIVSFSYPFSFQKENEQTSFTNNSIFLNGDITNFNFSYKLIPHSIHKPQWMPSTVFTDGKKTYLHFASAKKASYAPVLFIIENNSRILANYRVIGDYYIVDQVIDRAELVLDVNKGNIITIKREK